MSSWRVGAVLLSVLLSAGCQQGAAGRLKPVDGQQGEEAGSAVVREGAVSATVTARWASEASQSAYIVYRNDAAKPVSVILSHLKLHHEHLGDAQLWTVSDMTVVNRDDTRTNNDDPPTLYDMDTSPATTRLVLDPGERRALDVGFTNFLGTKRIASGDLVTATVPLGAGNRTIKMVAD